MDSIRDRLRSIIEEIEDWKYLSFPPLLPPEEEGGPGSVAGGEEKAERERREDREDEEMGEGE